MFVHAAKTQALRGPVGPTLGPGRCTCTKKPDEAWNGFEDPRSGEHRFSKLKRRKKGQIHSGGNRRKGT